MHGNESTEDYLETILILSNQLPVVRSIDIATELNYSKPSISVAMRNLREKGYIEVNKAGAITLTDAGLAIASRILERHDFISEWLISLGVSKEVALADACNMEHQISEESFHAMKKFIEAHR